MNPDAPSMTLSDRDLELAHPEIPWRSALPVTSLEDPSVRGLACRFCIARFGLRGTDVNKLPQTEEAWLTHMARYHTRFEEMN